VDFAEAGNFDWDNAVHRVDRRGDYGELRFVSTGRIGDRLDVCIWTPRGVMQRIIGLRKANPREQRQHVQTKKLH
jgi:uncharacterized protein